MKTVLAVFGALHALAFLLGAINLIDYHVCVKEVGKCSINSTVELYKEHKESVR